MRALFPQESALSGTVLAAAGVLHLQVRAIPNIQLAAQAALQLTGRHDMLVVTGSLYMIGAARTELQRRLFVKKK